MDARQSFLTARGCAEQSSAGSRGVVQGHVRRVVDGHPPGRRDGFGSGLLAVRGHLRLATVNLNYLMSLKTMNQATTTTPKKQYCRVANTTEPRSTCFMCCFGSNKQERLLADK